MEGFQKRIDLLKQGNRVENEDLRAIAMQKNDDDLIIKCDFLEIGLLMVFWNRCERLFKGAKRVLTYLK